MYDDQHAFKELFDIYFDKIFKVALSIIKDSDLAEEIAEDVFFNFWQMRRRYPEIRSVDNYLFISAKNLSLHYLKKNKGFLKITSDIIHEKTTEAHDPEKVFLTGELEDYLDRAVEKLPPKCKEIFKLVRLRGLKYKEVAKLLEISVKTVENQIAIALKKLHAELDLYYFERERAGQMRKMP
jgi:RNA polymerase sigma-70 factor (ECF subfamily)